MEIQSPSLYARRAFRISKPFENLAISQMIGHTSPFPPILYVFIPFSPNHALLFL